MAKAFLLFDFGSDEEAAQKARHRIEAWRQAFRLGNKVQFKVERAAASGEDAGAAEPESKGKNPSKKKEERDGGGQDNAQPIRLFICLDFSPHEKHLFQTWLARIPSEEPFSSKKPEITQRGSANFDETSELFDSLD